MTSAQRQTVLENISLHRQRNSPLLSDDYVMRLYLNGKQEIIATLQVFGFYEATVESSLDKGDESWTIQYNINTGKPIIVADVDLVIKGEGESNSAFTAWREKFPIHSGDRLNHQLYEEAKKEIQNLLIERGYFSSRLTRHEIQLSLKQHSGNIVIHVDTGPQYKFGDVTFIQETFDKDYLRRFIPFARGDDFIAPQLSEFQKNLAVSGEFRTIEITPLPESAVADMTPIHVMLVPRKPLLYRLGAGYGTDTGIRARAGLERRQITDTGHRADAEVFVSEVLRTITAHYRIPLKKPATDYLVFSGEHKLEDTDTTYSESNTVTVSNVYGLKSWLRTTSVSYLKENYTAGSEAKKSNLVIPSINFLFDPEKERRPVLHRPRWHFDVNVKGSHIDLASDVSFLQGRLYAELRFQLTRQFTLVARGDAGASLVGEFANLPVSQRFYAGGDYSVRGFDYKSLGPKDENGEVVGGTHLLVGSVEAQFMFKPNWDLAVFYDTGNAYDKDQFEPEQGAGAGIGYKSPFGVVRAYYATALSTSGNPWRPHIVVSADW
ncbi:MAG: BamA/TamA family outer membrane protein [Gammaproteobacteria bacterium]|nr:BamA/TamA family outer membrane protein [Gammaproteobacteria bacterium]